jgi:hypothetical protein
LEEYGVEEEWWWCHPRVTVVFLSSAGNSWIGGEIFAGLSSRRR